MIQIKKTYLHTELSYVLASFEVLEICKKYNIDAYLLTDFIKQHNKYKSKV